MCLDIKSYTLSPATCACHLYPGDRVVAIRTQGCKYADPDHPDHPVAYPPEICDPILNNRQRTKIHPTFPHVSCNVHDMLRRRGTDPLSLVPFVHQDFARFVECKACVQDNNEAFHELRHVVEMELSNKIVLDRYLTACGAADREGALAGLERELDFEVSCIEGPRKIVRVAVDS